ASPSRPPSSPCRSTTSPSTSSTPPATRTSSPRSSARSGVLDGAVLVLSAVEGVQPQTRILMRALQRQRIPTLLFVNKLNRLLARWGAGITRQTSAGGLARLEARLVAARLHALQHQLPDLTGG